MALLIFGGRGTPEAHVASKKGILAVKSINNNNTSNRRWPELNLATFICCTHLNSEKSQLLLPPRPFVNKTDKLSQQYSHKHIFGSGEQ